MGLSSSPSLQEYQHGIPEKPKDPAAHRRVYRLILLVLLLITLVGLVFRFAGSQTVMLLAGRGDVRGQVVDEQGRPLSAEVYLFGVDRPVLADAEGKFLYKGAPAGKRNLIIAFNGTAQELSVEIRAGEVTDVGKIVFLVATPTAIP
ncbi:MAG: carboxypeptidase-like regulatory domain-containing protein [Anaerolineales bacterium]|nr:carboxypeptidase-like regulatory domain-containing protein [Anaerolineales bacterium]MCX7609850.1 carboxypeptidase-like regulatory domain-containing protein [Anaerolineales bacterium]MDW8227317.1 carboxypeptidase-like regulatory domain-containing protein [Anaerolineales bacterium]